MRKVISLFQRNYDSDRLVRNEVAPGAEWVIAGEGIATRKWDGSCCRVAGGVLYKRYALKSGKLAPERFEPAQNPDPKTGEQPGWLPVELHAPEDRWFRVALAGAWLSRREVELPDGTYEAIGPHFGGGHHVKNPEGCAEDILVPHGKDVIEGFPREFVAIRRWFLTMGTNTGQPSIEGVVWHHPDGRLVKIKVRDFGLSRPAPLLTL